MTNTSNQQQLVRKVTVEGFAIEMRQVVLGQRDDVVTLPESEIEKIPKGLLLQVEDAPVEEFGKPEPAPETPEHAQWEEEKAAWEAAISTRPLLKKVTYLAPSVQNTMVKLEGYEVKVFHTLRGPMLGVVMNEDLTRAYLYSPCFIDPNIQTGRVHYLPMAFAGYKLEILKHTCMGISVPEIPVIMGYPAFIRMNERGEYTYRMKGAYHHIEADYPENARVVSTAADIRQHQMGFMPTSDTREPEMIAQAKALAQAARQQNPDVLSSTPAPTLLDTPTTELDLDNAETSPMIPALVPKS